jgi:predicted Zn-dependent protease
VRSCSRIGGLRTPTFKKALKLKPDLFDLSFWYAQNLLRIGEPAEAEVIFRKLIKQEPDRLDIQINLANSAHT